MMETPAQPAPAQKTIRKKGEPLQLLTRYATGSYNPLTGVLECTNRNGSFFRYARDMRMDQAIKWMDSAKNPQLQSQENGTDHIED